MKTAQTVRMEGISPLNSDCPWCHGAELDAEVFAEEDQSLLDFREKRTPTSYWKKQVSLLFECYSI